MSNLFEAFSRPLEYELNDILYSSNIIYIPETKEFVYNNDSSIIQNINNIVIIEEPVIIIHTLHSCYSHAILDTCFPCFIIIQELKKHNYIDSEDIRIMVRDKEIIEHPNFNLPLIDINESHYKGSYKDIASIITKHKIIFQHLTNKPIYFKKLFVYPLFDYWQRSIWNCSQIYPGRDVSIENVRFSDEYLFGYLKKFIERIFEYSNVNLLEKQENNLIIIDRKFNRKFCPNILKNIEELAKQTNNFSYNGTFILEDISFSEQVNLFNKNRIFIFRHGSALTNLLWVKPNCIIIELTCKEHVTHTSVVNRICHLTNSKVITVPYEESENFLNNIKSLFSYMQYLL